MYTKKIMYHCCYIILYVLQKYRRVVFDDKVDKTLKEICIGIEDRYEIHFVEIGVDKDHVHFLIQGVPIQSPKQIIQIVKSILGRELFIRHPEIKKQLRGGQLRTKGYYVNTVGRFVGEDVIKEYVKNQGLSGYKRLMFNPYKQQALFGM